jgi:hypothetical protein
MGLTFDTGALIGLERSQHHMRKVYDVAVSHDVRITVPSVVVAEWWRAGPKETERARILRSVVVESISDLVARLAGVALTLAPRAQTIDAIVIASFLPTVGRNRLHLGSEGFGDAARLRPAIQLDSHPASLTEPYTRVSWTQQNGNSRPGANSRRMAISCNLPSGPTHWLSWNARQWWRSGAASHSR